MLSRKYFFISFSEAAKPRSREAAKPRSREAAKPRSREAAKPRSREAAKPRSGYINFSIYILVLNLYFRGLNHYIAQFNSQYIGTKLVAI